MANKDLGTADMVKTMLTTNSVMVEIGGSIRRITLDDFAEAIQTGQLNLRQYACGVPLDETKTSQAWGRVGNTDMASAFLDAQGRYLMDSNGNAAKLSRTNSAFFADGTAVDETRGNVMFIGKDLHYLVQDDPVTGVPTLWMSEIPLGGHMIKAPCVGAYIGYVENNKLVSKSGVSPTGNKTISQLWNYARSNGDDYGLENWDFVRYMMMLNLLKYGNPNVQENVGYGVCGSANKDLWSAAATLKTGATISLGDACGKIDISVVNGSNTGENCSRVNFFGVEDYWGWLWNMIQGIYFGSRSNSSQDGSEVFIYDGNRMPTSTELASHPNGDYRQVTRVNAEGYVKNMYIGEYFDLIAKAVGGGSNSYWGDYFWRNFNGGQLCLCGGYANNGARCGLGYVTSNNAFSSANADVGSRLAFYGNPKLVNGADL